MNTLINRAAITRMLAVCGAAVWGIGEAAPAFTMSAAGASAPTIVGLSDRTEWGPGAVPIGPILFTVGDDVTPADVLVVTASSSNQDLVPDAAISVGGSGATRALAFTATQDITGTPTTRTTTITVSVSDGAETTRASFTLTVTDGLPTFVMAEGVTGPFFDTDILIGVPGSLDLVPVRVEALKDDGTTVVLHSGLMWPRTRGTIHVDEVPGLEDTTFSTIVRGPVGLAVERTVRWGASGYGAHTEKASEGPARQWFFAEGAQGTFFTYFLLVNPQTTANTAHITYFRESAPPVVRHYPMLPSSRLTIGAGDDKELRDTAFGARVDFDLPGMAERAMYFGTSPLWTGGHSSAGVTKPSSLWFLAEGATGTFFSTFVLLANPGNDDAQATLTYLPTSGKPIVKTVTIPAGQRMTRNIAFEDPALADAAVGVRIEATRPIVVERSQYWPNPAWSEAHNSFGVTETGQRWQLAEGGVGGPNNEQTYILIANPGTQPAEAQLTFLFPVQPDKVVEPIVKRFTVAPGSRFNVAVAGPESDVPELVNTKFSTIVDATAPIVVERSLYWDADGATWAAGTNATAARVNMKPPIAKVGPDQTSVAPGATITLDGSQSVGFGFGFLYLFSDNPLRYQWTLLTKPAGSQAALSGATTATPGFVVDVAGEYVAQLIVRDNLLTSAPETVVVSTARPPVDVSVTAPDSSASERGPDPGTFVFTRAGGNISQPLTIHYEYGGMAEPRPFAFPFPDFSGDYVDFGKQSAFKPFNARAITIPANQTSVTVTVTPLADGREDAPTEPLVVNLIPNRAYAIVAGTATITIEDDPTAQAPASSDK